jgi:hypothetical protein
MGHNKNNGHVLLHTSTVDAMYQLKLSNMIFFRGVKSEFDVLSSSSKKVLENLQRRGHGTSRPAAHDTANETTGAFSCSIIRAIRSVCHHMHVV